MGKINKRIFIILLLLWPGISVAVERFYRVDFEEGSVWNMKNYSTYDSGYLKVTDQNCAGGGFCGQAASIIDKGGQMYSPWFSDVDLTQKVYNGSKEFFFRMKTKYPVDWEEQATDDIGGGGANHIRFEKDNATTILEYTKQFKSCQFATDTNGTPGHNNGSYYFYDNKPIWDANDYYRKDGQWHEEAYYFKLPSSEVAIDGEFYVWTDGGPDYDFLKADTHTTWQWPTRYTPRLPQKNLVISFGNYYKGYVNDGYNPQFWMDDIEIWDGIPKAIPVKYSLANFMDLVSNWFKSGFSDLNNDDIINAKDLGIMMGKWE